MPQLKIPHAATKDPTAAMKTLCAAMKTQHSQMNKFKKKKDLWTLKTKDNGPIGGS